MAILSAYVHKNDPAVKLARDTALVWLDLWRDHPQVRNDARAAWRQAHADVVADDPSVRWHKVTGPLSATVATMTSMDWQVKFPKLWVDPTGRSWAIDADGTRREVQRLVEDITAAKLWQHAALGWQGKGFEEGIDVDATLSVHAVLSKAGKHAEAAMLEALLCGGCWSPQRVHLMRGGLEEACRRFNEPGADDLHTYWTCPGGATLNSPDIVAMQYLVANALDFEQGAAVFPCL